MTFGDRHELAMLRSADKLMDGMLVPEQYVTEIRIMLDRAFSAGALFVLEDDLHQIEDKIHEPAR